MRHFQYPYFLGLLGLIPYPENKFWGLLMNRFAYIFIIWWQKIALKSLGQKIYHTVWLYWLPFLDPWRLRSVAGSGQYEHQVIFEQEQKASISATLPCIGKIPFDICFTIIFQPVEYFPGLPVKPKLEDIRPIADENSVICIVWRMLSAENAFILLHLLAQFFSISITWLKTYQIQSPKLR